MIRGRMLTNHLQGRRHHRARSLFRPAIHAQACSRHSTVAASFYTGILLGLTLVRGPVFYRTEYA